MICEPKRGRREMLEMEHRTKIEFTHCVWLLIQCYSDAEAAPLLFRQIRRFRYPARLISNGH